MLLKLGLITVLCFWCFSGIVAAQELSTEVYASEEELYEALRLGEIEYDQYRVLLELATYELDNPDSWLFDLIPNQTYFDSTSLKDQTELQSEQQQAFTRTRSNATVRYRFFQDLDVQSRNGFRLDFALPLKPRWEVSAGVHREYSGSERIVSRKLTYHDPKGWLRQVSLGSFRARLGLGTVYGYRGNLFDFSRNLDVESALFPDYGGYNGIFASLIKADWQLDLLGSVTRDSLCLLRTGGGMIGLKSDRMSHGLIFGFSRLENRVTGALNDDIKLAASTRMSYRHGSVAVEATGQMGDSRSAGAFVMEGKHAFRQATVKYSGWGYGRHFVNLTSGSKAAQMSRKMTLDDTEFEYSDKLSGQRGGLLKTILKLSPDWELATSVVAGFREFDSSRVEFLSSISHQVTRSFSVRADFLSRRRQTGPGSAAEDTDQQARIEGRLNLGRIKARSYISFTHGRENSDYWGWFGALKYRIEGFGQLELWSNMGRIRRGEVEYWYLFLKYDQDLSEQMVLQTKISNSYRASIENHQSPLISLELVARF